MNIRGINPESRTATEKSKKIEQLLETYSPDVLCFSETNTAWHLVAGEDRLNVKIREMCGPLQVQCAWFGSYPTLSSSWQPGGAAIAVLGSYASSVIGSGCDPMGLGRWAWIRIQGKNGKNVTIFSAYRPVRSPDKDFSVWSQQQDALIRAGYPDDVDPRTIFVQDLKKEITTAQQRRDTICLSIDANDDLNSSNEFTDLMTELKLVDSCINLHGSDGPPTRQNGRNPIDGLYWSEDSPVVAAGYGEFTEGLSDHRPLFTDSNTQALFGYESPPTIRFTARRLKCEDPRIVKRFLEVFDKFLAREKLYERAEKLEASIKGPLTPEQEKEYEIIDRIAAAGRLAAKKKCRKLRLSRVPFTPKLQAAMDNHRFWFLLAEKHTGKRISSSRITRLGRRLGLSNFFGLSPAAVIDQRELAWKEYKSAKKSAKDDRIVWLEDLAVARAEAGLESASNALRVMKFREQVKRNFRRIKSATNATYQRALVKVQSVCPLTGRIIDHVTKSGIEQACAEGNEARFRQCNPTPPQHPVVIDLLGADGCSAIATRILQTGQIPAEIHALDPYLGELLASFHVKRQIPAVDMNLPTQEHVQGWKRSRESTSSSWSGIHFGHYIASSRNPNTAAFDAIMSSIPWQTGYSPQRWRVGINVMLEKKQGDWLVDRLRTILLLEADFNQGNKRMGRKMMRNAEAHSLLAPEQYGSRKNHMAIDLGLNKTLTYDLARQRKQRLAMCPVDCKGCYDRMAHVCVGIGMRRSGATVPAVQCMLSTLQQLKHYVRTAFGDSDIFFEADDGSGIPIGGTCQGNGASPTIWALVSTPIFDAMRRRGYGVFLKSAVSGKLLQFVGYAFVDDTDLACTDETLDYYALHDSIQDKIQTSITFWEGFLRATGGAIRPDKCHWYLIDFDWQEDGTWKYRDIHPEDPPLQVRDLDGVLQTIERLPVNMGKRTVGVRLAPDGNVEDEYKYLESTIDEWCKKITKSRLPKHLVWASLQTGILRKLSYPLPATTFTKDQCEKLMRKLLKTALPHSQVNRHFPEVMRHAPETAAGFAILHLYVEQGIQHLHRLVTYGPRPEHITGHLLNCSVEQLSLELGITGCPFQKDFKAWSPLATSCWVKSVWQFLTEYKIEFKSAIPSIPLQRGNDKMIMEHIMTHGTLPAKQLQAINRCRLYLQVARLSDIYVVDGTRLKANVWSGVRRPYTGTSAFAWPRQPRPVEADWKMWREMLSSVWGVTATNLNCTYRLGSWTTPVTEWEWLVSADHQTLFHRQESGGYKRYVAAFDVDKYIDNDHLVPHWMGIAQNFEVHRADVTIHDTCFAYVHTRERAPLQWNTEIDLDFPTLSYDKFRCNEIRQRLSWTMQTEFQGLSDEAILALAHALEHGGVKGVSDGSVKDNIGSAAWTIVIPTFGTVAGGFVIPGNPEEHDSYRAEVLGITAILQVVREITRAFHLTDPQLEIGCDNKGALYRLFLYGKQASMRDNQWDAIMIAKTIMNSFEKLHLEWRHVKGHQDVGPLARLDEWARLNVWMDECAKVCRESGLPAVQIPLLQTLWMPSIQQKPLLREVTKAIRDRALADPAKQYWKNTKKIGTADPSVIDWKNLGSALHEEDPTRRRWITKHSTDWCGVNKNLVRWDMASDDRCPRCRTPSETADHVWRCPARMATILWQQQCRELEEWFEAQDTAPDLSSMLLSRLRSWRAGTRSGPYRGTYPGLAAALHEQDTVTWSAAFMGRWSHLWAPLQDNYYKSIKSSRSGKRWLINLTRKLWKIAFQMWEQRNSENAELTAIALRATLQIRVRQEYARGGETFHPASRRLFTAKSLNDRLQQTNQLLESWLLRVRTARARANQAPNTTPQQRLVAVARRTRRLQRDAYRTRIRGAVARRTVRVNRRRRIQIPEPPDPPDPGDGQPPAV